MKKNKITFLVLAVALVMGVVACTPENTEYRNMETRLNDNNRDNGWLNNDRNRLNTNLNNGMTRRDMNNDMWDNGTNLNDSMRRNNTNLDSGMIGNNNMNNMDNMNNISTRANNIAKRIAALDEVDSASVVINGNTAIVGIDTNTNMDKNNNISSSLKQKVEAAVKAGDKNIKDIKITLDPDITSRLKTMSTELNRGNPISEFARDIEDILERIANPRR